MSDRDPASVMMRLFDRYAAGDVDGVGDLLAEDVIAHVTTSDGGVDRVQGRAAYLARLPDLGSAQGGLTVTQVVGVDDERALSMVEIMARRDGRDDLHNVAGFLARVADGRVTELWMVDAKPAGSAAFWA